jgi:CHASE2 domain-containing sensor protein/tRNA A-37 threonylcarbamoyl transferase component Bud32
MSQKRSPATLLQTLSLTLRSRLFRHTTMRQAEDLQDRTLPLPYPEPALTEPDRSKLPSRLKGLGHGLMGFWAIAAALATATAPDSVQYWERQTQSRLFQLRGAVPVPDDLVILAIDDETLQNLSDSRWPMRRAIYAAAINRMMQAGAKAIALNLLLDTPSSYGSAEASGDCSHDKPVVSADDRELQKVLQRYDGRIVLGMKYSALDSRQGDQFRISLPYCPFRTPKAIWGAMRFPLEQNVQVHRLGSEDLKAVKADPERGFLFEEEPIFSFAEATLKAAKVNYPTPKGENLFFYGYDGAFSKNTIPFWNVLSAENWNSQYLQNGRVFKDKIVVIGATTPQAGDDRWDTPFRSMMTTELQTNAIATLLYNKSIRNTFPNPAIAGLVVLGLVLASGVLQIQAKQPVTRLGWASAIAAAWAGVGYALFTQGLMIVPIAVPSTAMILVGISYLGTGLAHEYRNKRQFRRTLKQYARVPVVQELISQQDDFRDLIQEREAELLGSKLGGRYRITRVLGSGGFGETYIAEDTQRPGSPQCVVKQLRPTSSDPKHLQLARRLFRSEAETLEKLGKHDQIPRLLANFEEDGEFYLVQEFIEGTSLSQELAIGRHLPEARIVSILQELLTILTFVHSHNVIHRDIKPSNVIRRHADNQLVLIDFGAVKELHQLTETEAATVTIGIGTQGYMPPEQCAGNPRLNSDLYAVAMMGIQGLTGLPPSQLKSDPQTGDVMWRDLAIVSDALATVLEKMVHHDFRQRYQSTAEVLQDLTYLTYLSSPSITEFLRSEDDDLEDDITTTRPWPNAFGSEDLPQTEPPDTEAYRADSNS